MPEILSLSVEDWIVKLLQEFTTPDIPVIYPDRITRSEVSGSVPAYAVPNPTYDKIPSVQGLIHKFHLPFTGNRNFFHYHPAGWNYEFPGAEVLADELVLAVGGAWLTPENIEKSIDGRVAQINQALDGFRSDAERFKQNLPGILRPRIEDKRRKAEAEYQTAAKLRYPIKRDTDAPQTYKLPERPRQIAPKPAPLRVASAEQEFVLDEPDYQEILRICTSMSLVMERSPTVFEKAEEEHIRVHYLVQLNGQFRGAATGETFNGKTDILIRQGDKNVFVAECKFWGGYKDHLATIDQLLGYTTWRDTKTAIIIFNRNQDFTGAISEAQRAMKDHPHYKSGPTKEAKHASGTSSNTPTMRNAISS